MKAITKLIINSPRIWWILRRSKKLAKKYKRSPELFTPEWRSNYALKKAKVFTKIINAKITVKGWENIPKTPSMITPNHSSSFDPSIMLISLEKKDKLKNEKNPLCVFLAKKELANSKFRGYFALLDTFMIDRKNPRSALKTLNEYGDFVKKEHRHAIIFPEGTRSKNGKIQDFHSGAFRMAKKEFMPIVPVTINNSLSASDLSRKKPLKIEVIFHKALKPSSFLATENKDIALKVKKIVESAWVKPEGKRSKKEGKLA